MIFTQICIVLVGAWVGLFLSDKITDVIMAHAKVTTHSMSGPFALGMLLIMLSIAALSGAAAWEISGRLLP